MGPQFIAAFPRDPLMWTAMLVSLIVAAFLAYEIALDTPPPVVRVPGWLSRSWGLFYRWFPRLVMPILLALGWLWL